MYTLHSTPRADGFAMPAEWAPHSQTWMLWPERPDNWRDAGAPAQTAFAEVARAIASFEPVTVGVSAGQYARANQLLDHPAIRVVELSSDDAWVRDTGPTFVTNGQGGCVVSTGSSMPGVVWTGDCILRGIETIRWRTRSSGWSAAHATAPRALCWRAGPSMWTARAPCSPLKSAY